jgi:spoIIIJ-associated protein
MNIEDVLKETTEDLLKHLGIVVTELEVSEEEKDLFHVNIKSENASLLIGHHGENIQALQHLVKVLSWEKLKNDNQFHVIVDIDNYRKRQEDTVISLAERKVEFLRRTRRPQILPPMSPYFRRKIHLHLMGSGFDDIETTSEGDDDTRHVVIQLKPQR